MRALTFESGEDREDAVMNMEMCSAKSEHLHFGSDLLEPRASTFDKNSSVGVPSNGSEPRLCLTQRAGMTSKVCKSVLNGIGAKTRALVWMRSLTSNGPFFDGTCEQSKSGPAARDVGGARHESLELGVESGALI